MEEDRTKNLTINTLPIEVPERYRNAIHRNLMINMARQELLLTKNHIISSVIELLPEGFEENVILNLSISLPSYKVKIDYSMIQNWSLIDKIKSIIN